MTFQVTVRYGRVRQRYQTYVVEGADAREALWAAATAMSDDVAAETDLVELRMAVDPEKRTYLE